MFPSHLYNINNKLKNRHFHSKFCNLKFNSLLDKFILSIRNLEIKDICFHINFLKKELSNIITTLNNSSIDKHIIRNIFIYQDNKFVTYSDKFNKIYNNKFTINNNKQNVINVENNELVHLKNNWFINLQDLQVPKDVIDVVSLGNNFSYEDNIKKSDIIDTIKNFEYVTRNIEYHNNQRWACTAFWARKTNSRIYGLAV